MPSFDIVRKIEPDNTFRVSSVIGAFDIDLEHTSEHFKGNLNIEGANWNVGLIVGSSGSGKSTIAKELFPDNYIKGYEYKAKSVIDDMPEHKTMREIEMMFTSVGFSSPPSWLKPYSVLSNGERMRVDLARSILEDNEIIVFDEFTSVVNREVAKTSSYAISKAVRKNGKKFVAVSCHDDIKEWLEPDWIYDTDLKEFFFAGIKGQKSILKSTRLITLLKKRYGTYLENITI